VSREINNSRELRRERRALRVAVFVGALHCVQGEQKARLSGRQAPTSRKTAAAMFARQISTLRSSSKH
jgi:hypothetical protein